jgi:hypothetical protein
MECRRTRETFNEPEIPAEADIDVWIALDQSCNERAESLVSVNLDAAAIGRLKHSKRNPTRVNAAQLR